MVTMIWQLQGTFLSASFGAGYVFNIHFASRFVAVIRLQVPFVVI